MIRKKVFNLFLILLGTFILAVSVEMFILPYHILSGGVAGIAVAVEPFFHIDETLFANGMILAPVLDETIQLFVPGRAGALMDVMIDMSGYFAAWATASLIHQRISGQDG